MPQPIWQGDSTPPPYGKIPVEHGFSLRGASLTRWKGKWIANLKMIWSYLVKGLAIGSFWMPIASPIWNLPPKMIVAAKIHKNIAPPCPWEGCRCLPKWQEWLALEFQPVQIVASRTRYDKIWPTQIFKFQTIIIKNVCTRINQRRMNQSKVLARLKLKSLIAIFNIYNIRRCSISGCRCGCSICGIFSTQDPSDHIPKQSPLLKHWIIWKTKIPTKPHSKTVWITFHETDQLV